MPATPTPPRLRAVEPQPPASTSNLPPSDQWTARADWVDAEDGSVVCLRPDVGYGRSFALWPKRRDMLAAAPDMFAALQTLCSMRNMSADDLTAAWDAARSAIAKARGA